MDGFFNRPCRDENTMGNGRVPGKKLTGYFQQSLTGFMRSITINVPKGTIEKAHPFKGGEK